MMPTHDPSPCSRCRWAAERLYYEWDEHGCFWMTITLNDDLLRVDSFCTSLDAVMGLMKELNKHGRWCHTWISAIRQWRYYALPYGAAPYFDAPEGLPGACVIEAAMEVLGGKEEGDASPQDAQR